MVNRASSLYRWRTVGFWARVVAVGTCLLPGTAAQAAILNVAAGEVVVLENDLCSLREAINNSETDTQADNDDCPTGSGADVINLAAGSTYTLPDADAFSSANGLRPVTTELVVNGNGSTIERDGSLTCVIDNSPVLDQEFRILRIDSPGDVTLNDLTLRNGCADGPGGSDDGGAIAMVSATLALNRVTITESIAQDKSGGLDTGRISIVTIVDSTFTLNSSSGGGGGIGNGGSSVMTIEGSTIADNSAAGQGGGGIGNLGSVTILNSTISGNSDVSSGGGGGGIGSSDSGTVELVHSTVTDNDSTGALGGGGIGNAGDIQVKNSIVADNGTGGDCVNLDDIPAFFAAVGANFDTDGTCAALDADFTQVTPVQLALGPLADNGGPTETHALLPGSVAVDAATDCTLLDGSTPVTEDQRDVARPQGPSCDAGSFELAEEIVVLPPILSKSFAPNQIAVGGVSTLTFTIENPNSTVMSDVSLEDDFPAGLEVAATPNVTTIGCGAVDFDPEPAAGDTEVVFSGGTIAPFGTCTVSVDVTATTSGDKVNSVENADSDAGESNSATATLTVGGAVGIMEIPSLSQWGLLLLALTLAGAAAWRLRLG